MRTPGLAALLLPLPLLASAQSDTAYRPKPGSFGQLETPGFDSR